MSLKSATISGTPTSVSSRHFYTVILNSFKISKTINISIEVKSSEKTNNRRKTKKFRDDTVLNGIEMEIIEYSVQRVPSVQEFDTYNIITSRIIDTMEIYNNNSKINPLFCLPPSIFNLNYYHAIKFHGFFIPQSFGNYEFRILANDGYILEFPSNSYSRLSQNIKSDLTDRKLVVGADTYPMEFNLITTRFLELNTFRFEWRIVKSGVISEFQLISSENCQIPISSNITNAFYTKSNNIIIETEKNNPSTIIYPFYNGTVTKFDVYDSLPSNILLDESTGILTVTNPSTGSTNQNIEISFRNDNIHVQVKLMIIFLSKNHPIIIHNNNHNNGILTKYYSITNINSFHSDDITLSQTDMYLLKKSYISTITEMNNEYNELSSIWITLPYNISLPYIAVWNSLVYFPLSWNYCFYMDISSTPTIISNDISFIFIDGVNITAKNSKGNMACLYVSKGYHKLDFHSVLYVYNRNIHFYINSTSISLLNYNTNNSGIINVDQDYIIPYYRYDNYINGFIYTNSKDEDSIIYPVNNEEIFFYKFRKLNCYRNIAIPINIPIFNYDNINPYQYSVYYPDQYFLNSIGLEINTNTGVISGIPNIDYLVETTIIIVMIGEDSITYYTNITLSIESAELSDEDIEYSINTINVLLWKEVNLSPTILNESIIIDNFTIVEGNLPQKLTLNPLTGVISGIAEEIVDNRYITILISNHGSSIRKSININIYTDCVGDIDPIFFYFNFTGFRNQRLSIVSNVSGNIFTASGTNKEESRIICGKDDESITITINRDDTRDNPYLSLTYYPNVYLYNENAFNTTTAESYQFIITFSTYYDKPSYIDINNTVKFTVFDNINYLPSIGSPYSLCVIEPYYLPIGLVFDNRTCGISGNSLYSTETNNHNIDYTMILSNPHSSIYKQFQLKIENCDNSDSELIELYIINNYNSVYGNDFKLLDIMILNSARQVVIKINDFESFENQNYITQYFCMKKDIYIVQVTFSNNYKDGIDLKESNSNIEIYITTFNGFILFYFNSKYVYNIRPRITKRDSNQILTIESEMNINKLMISYNSTIYYTDVLDNNWLNPKYDFRHSFIESKIFSIPYYQYNTITRYYKTGFNIEEDIFYISSIITLSIYYTEGIIVYINNKKIFTDSVDNTTYKYGINHNNLYNMLYFTISVLDLNLSMNYINVEVHQSRDSSLKDINEDYYSITLDIYEEKCFQYNNKIPIILSSNIDNFDNNELYKLLQPVISEDFTIYYNQKVNFTLDIYLPKNYYIIINRYTVISSINNIALINIPISWKFYGVKTVQEDNILVCLDEENDVVFTENYESKIFYLPPRSSSYNKFKIIFTKVGLTSDIIQQSVVSLNSFILEGCNIQYCIYEGYDPVEIGNTIRLNCPADETGYIEKKCLLNFETKKPYWSSEDNYCKLNPPKLFEIIPLESKGYTGYPIETVNLLCSGRNVGYNITPSLPNGIKLIASQINGISQNTMYVLYNISCCNDGGCITKSFRLNVKLAACTNDDAVVELHSRVLNRNKNKIKLRRSNEEDNDDDDKDEDYWPTTMVGNTSVINCKAPLIGTKERSCYFDSYPVWGRITDNCKQPNENKSDIGTIVGVIIGVLAILIFIVGTICCLKSKRIKRQSLMINASKARTYSSTRRNNNGGINLSEFGFIQ